VEGALRGPRRRRRRRRKESEGVMS